METVQEFGLYLPSTYTFDVARLQEIEVNSPEFKELLVRLYQNINNMILSLNMKESALYDNTNEFVTGAVYYPRPGLTSTTQQESAFRQEYRTTIDFGALPNAGNKNVPHGIVFTSQMTFTQIYATATDTTNLQAIPIPYIDAGLVTVPPPTLTPSPLGNIQIYVDATDVWITTTANLTNFDQCIVILEYLKF